MENELGSSPSDRFFSCPVKEGHDLLTGTQNRHLVELMPRCREESRQGEAQEGEDENHLEKGETASGGPGT